jgi:hypothetical protein
MTEDQKNEAENRWLECLQAVQSLSAETNAAMAALAGNDLERFESSVAAQEQLCENLRGVLRRVAREPLPKGPLTVASLQPLAAAGRELRQRNQTLATVLTRAAQVCGALLSLYQDSPRGYARDGRNLPANHTWSCEV